MPHAMSDPVIRVENLGKHYRLRHQQPERYTALRDVIAHGTQSFLQRLNPRNFRQPETLSQSEEDFWALKDVSFEVNAGDRIGIIGRNGAGKSTLLKILSRITEPTTGSIRIKGRVASLLEVGTGFHPELTGRENIYLNGAILGMSKEEIRRKFEEIVAFAEVEKFLDMPVKRYSSGMYVRLAFAVAAHLEPEILIVDEVLAVGDTQFQKKCLGKMEEVGKEGRTVLFVSHSMAALRSLCSKAILLNQGKLIHSGETLKVIEQYTADSKHFPSFVSLLEDRARLPEIAHLKSLELLNNLGEQFACAWDEPIHLRICISVLTQVENLSLNVGCITTDGVPLFTIRSIHNMEIPSVLNAQEYEFETIIYHSLRAGIYKLVLGLSIGGKVIQYCDSAAQIEILPIGKIPYQQENPGIINCPSSWKVGDVVATPAFN